MTVSIKKKKQFPFTLERDTAPILNHFTNFPILCIKNHKTYTVIYLVGYVVTSQQHRQL